MRALVRFPIAALASLGWLAGCGSAGIDFGQVQLIEAPATPGSETPNLALGLDGKLYLSWIEPQGDGHALRFATWLGAEWSAPGTVAAGQDWVVNWADFPSLAAAGDSLAAHWLVKSGEGYAYEVRVALSRDGGATWGAALCPHRDETKTEHGFVTLVPHDTGEFGIVWLDGRKMADTPPGPMTLRHAVLRPDGTLEAESEIDGQVCDCCSTDAARTADGATLVVYRDRSDAEVRDISVTRLEGSSWSAPRTLHADEWTIPGCPVNGPAVSAHGDRVAAAWFTAARDEPQVQVAFSPDAGRTFETPLRIDQGHPLGRVDVVLLDDGSAFVSWIEETPKGALITVRRARPGAALESMIVARTAVGRSSGCPRMARLGDRIMVAWTDTGPPSRILTAAVALGPESKP